MGHFCSLQFVSSSGSRRERNWRKWEKEAHDLWFQFSRKPGSRTVNRRAIFHSLSFCLTPSFLAREIGRHIEGPGPFSIPVSLAVIEVADNIFLNGTCWSVAIIKIDWLILNVRFWLHRGNYFMGLKNWKQNTHSSWHLMAPKEAFPTLLLSPLYFLWAESLYFSLLARQIKNWKCNQQVFLLEYFWIQDFSV